MKLKIKKEYKKAFGKVIKKEHANSIASKQGTIKTDLSPAPNSIATNADG